MKLIERIHIWETQLDDEITEIQADKLEAKIERAFDKITNSTKLQDQYEDFYGIEWMG